MNAEPDSDPEFNPGAFVYETKEKAKRGHKSSDASPPRKSRARRSDVLGGTRSSSSGEHISTCRWPMNVPCRTGKAFRRAEEPKTNPLLQYFGMEIGYCRSYVHA